MTNEEYRLQWLKWHAVYERKAFRIFRNALKKSFESMPINNITYENYKVVVDLNVHIKPIEDSYFEVYKMVGLVHGKRVGNGINREIKRFDNDLFSQDFLDKILDWVRGNAGERITGVDDTTKLYIRNIIDRSFKEGLSVFEMRDVLFKNLNSPLFTKHRALVIARTETTTAANHSATIAGESAGIVLEKVWISTKDKRTRDPNRYHSKWSHVRQDGKTVGQFEDFEMHSTDGRTNMMTYPGDIKGSEDNVIMCRCTVAYRPLRDKDGFVVTR